MNGLKIGNVHLDGNLILAPMAGVTDLPYRVICKEFGADLVFSEMISAKGIYYNNSNTKKLLETDSSEHPCGIQLFGNDPVIMSEMAAKIENEDFEIFDINMGCPVPKVVNNGEGSALMNDPELASKVVSAIVKKVKKPVTVKFRKGFKKDDDTAVEFAKMIEAAGASAITVHGRTREQYYSGKADWDVIARVKKAVKIPVIGNGDLFTPEDVKRMYEMTGVDGFALGRGARGNPWLFKRIKVFMETGELLPPPGIEEICDMMIRHAQMNVDFKGEYTGIREMRKHASWYTAGLPNSSKVRAKLGGIETVEDLKEVLGMVR